MSIKALFLKFARNATGLVIVFLDWLSRPKPLKRSPEAQAATQQRLVGHSLYQFYACPFCVKTRRALHKLGITIEAKDINKEPQNRIDLEQGGGRVKVPCLRIDDADGVTWMYESSEIIKYLQNRVA